MRRHWKDYYKSKRCHDFQVKCSELNKRLVSHHYYANVLHWRLREWLQAPKLYH